MTLLRRLDENWYEGRLNHIEGIFPAAYVETLKEPPGNEFNRNASGKFDCSTYFRTFTIEIFHERKEIFIERDDPMQRISNVERENHHHSRDRSTDSTKVTLERFFVVDRSIALFFFYRYV